MSDVCDVSEVPLVATVMILFENHVNLSGGNDKVF